jgi:hypothetical protein
MDACMYRICAAYDGNANIGTCTRIPSDFSPLQALDLSCVLQPGLAFFYGGLVHRKSVLTIMMQVITSSTRVAHLSVISTLSQYLSRNEQTRGGVARGSASSPWGSRRRCGSSSASASPSASRWAAWWAARRRFRSSSTWTRARPPATPWPPASTCPPSFSPSTR